MFDDKEHVRFATLPGMWERTVTVESAGSKYITLRIKFPIAHSIINHRRNVRSYRVEDWLAYRALLDHSTHAGCDNPYRVL